MPTHWLISLLIASLCGAALGLEREWHRKPAGLRTNTLICMGSALFTIASPLFAGPEEQTRIASLIVSGVGFLGAGTILHHRNDFVVGLTSAATVWVAAAIGMFAGSGHRVAAIVATAATLLILVFLRRAEQYLAESHKTFIVEMHFAGPLEGRRQLVSFLIAGQEGKLVFLTPALANNAPPQPEVPEHAATHCVRAIYAARESAHERILAKLATLPGILEIKRLHALPDYKE